MRYLLVLSFIFLLVVNSYPQSKYFVYFKDKGIDSHRLSKTSKLYQEAEQLLTRESIERRKQVMGDNYITFEDLPVNENYVASLESSGINIIHKLKWFNAVSCYLTDDQLKNIQNLNFVKSIEQVRSFKKSEPVEETETQQMQLNKSNFLLDYGASLTQNNLSEIPVVHDLGINGEGVIVGLLDTGFRRTIPALQSRNVIAERDFIQGDNNTANEGNDRSDQDSHGTHVFTIAGGYAPGNVIGPAYGAKFLLAKTEYVPTETNAEEDNYAAALEWMESQGVHITSSSLGYSTFDTGETSYTYQQMDGKTTIVARAANLAFDRGVTTLTSAGNEGSSAWGATFGGDTFGKITSPADAFNIIAVGAMTPTYAITTFSSRGPTSDGRIKPEIVAQGSNVFYGNVAGGYGSGGGTSYSAPIAAGVAALLKSAFPHLTNKQVRQIILESGDSTATPNNNRGYGLISAKKAITYPNISFENGLSIINKAFIITGGVNESTIKIFFREEGQSFLQGMMTKKNNYAYTYEVSSSFANKNVEFYFTYQDNSGNSYREPATSNFRFKYGSWAIDNILTDIYETDQLPSEFALSQNYPNPFNPTTTISYSIPVAGFVSLKVFDLLGREATTLVNEFKQPGTYHSAFSILNLPAGRQGSQFASGVYIYLLKAGNFVQSKKMMVLK
jgi:subtilisin family serine protease